MPEDISHRTNWGEGACLLAVPAGSTLPRVGHGQANRVTPGA